MKEEILPIYCDFDGTLSDTQQIGEEFVMGEEIPYMVQAVNNASREREIVIFTARPEYEWEAVKSWLEDHHVNYQDITNIKRPAKYYVDDRALPISTFASIYAKRR